MHWPSLTTILSVAFLAYMANSLWSIAQLFLPPNCDPADKDVCLKSALDHGGDPARRILLFSTLKARPNMDRDMDYLGQIVVKDPNVETAEGEEVRLRVSLPKRVRDNGTMYLGAFTVPYKEGDDPAKDWLAMVHGEEATYAMVPLTQYHIPEAETFNLLGEDKKPEKKEKKKETVSREKPRTHLRSKVTLSLMAEGPDMPSKQVPGELYYLMRRSPSDPGQYLPILYVDELSLRIRDLVLVNATDEAYDVAFAYRPISFGKLRMFLQFTAALSSMHGLGFTAKDTDEVKGIFADTSLALLLVTFSVSAVHLLFDFLAFKNDVSFWRGKRTMEGMSSTTILWRAFSQSVIFLYLMDEETSMLVLIPSGVAAVIEMWKVRHKLNC